MLFIKLNPPVAIGKMRGRSVRQIWPLAVGRWPLAVGRWPSAVGRWPLAVGILVQSVLAATENFLLISFLIWFKNPDVALNL